MVTNNWVKILTMENIRCKNNVGGYMYTTTLIIINVLNKYVLNFYIEIKLYYFYTKGLE